MDPAVLTDLAQRLRGEEKDLSQQIEAYERTRTESLKDSSQELSGYDNHPADLGTETCERSKDLALLDNVRALRHEVRRALARMDAGKFGICDRCGREIDYDRLSAIPHTDLCLDCRREIESMDPPRWRPIEEEVLSPPFGRSFKDHTAVAAYDGEDTWQDLARHGSSNTPSDVGGTDALEDAYIDHDEHRGLVEMVDGLIDVGPDAIPPDPPAEHE